MPDFEERMRALRELYLKRSLARVKGLAESVSRLRGDLSNRDALRDLMRGFHQLAGSGGTYGLDQVSDLGGRGEEAVSAFMESGRDPEPEDVERFGSWVDALRTAFSQSRSLVPPSHAAPVSAPARKVLLVEEDPKTAQVLRRALEDGGFSVTCAATYEEARKSARENFPEALVAEILLKEGSGYDLVRWFRDQPGGGAPAVLAVSTLDRFLDKVEALTCGADGFLAKPLDPADLVRRLSAILSKQQAPAARILAVEDDTDQAAFLQVVLESAGYEVQTCGDPAHFEIELAEFRPDLVMMDVDLPGASGIDLVRYLRQEDAYRTLPTIFLTRHAGVHQQVRALRGGGDDFITKPASPARILASVAAQVEKARLLQGLVEHDGLTGLLTHSAFFERAKGVLLRRRRYFGKAAALVMLDVDHFKSVNDRHGHPTGDRVLATLGAFLRKRLRQSDMLGRYGGEEFALLLEDLEPEAVERLVGRLLEEFAALRHRDPDGKSFCITLSAGLACFGPGHETLEQWLSAADGALYEAKAAGRNCLRRAASSGATCEGGPAQLLDSPDPILDQCMDSALLTALPVGVILLGEEGSILWCNSASERILGAAVGHLPGKRLSAQLRDPIQEDGTPFPEEDLPSSQVLREGHPAAGTVVGWTRADGTRGWLSVNVQPSPRAGKSNPWAAVISFEDITLRKRIQEDLRKLTTAVVNNPAGIVISNSQGNIEYVNPKFEEMTGYTSEEVLGQNPRMLKSGLQDKGFYQQMWRELASGRVWRGEFHNRRKDGAVYWESASISPVKDASGAVTHYVAVKEDITQHKRSQKLLEEQREELEAIYDNAPLVMMLLDGERRICKVNRLAQVFANGGTEDLLGLRSGEALQCIHALDDPRGCGFGPHCGECKVRQTTLGTLDTGIPAYGVECSLPFDVGGKETPLTFLLSTTRLEIRENPMVLVSLLDITERKRAEKALLVSEARQRSLLDHAMNGLLAVGESGAIESANPAAENMFGFRSGEMLSLPLALLLPDAIIGGLASTEAPNQRSVIECRARRKDGALFPSRLSLFRVPTAEGMRLKVEVEDLTALQGAERAKREFVSVVSHELRTPLTSIRGSLGLVAGGVAGELPGKAKDLVAIALKNCQRLTMLINDILDLEKAESGKMEFLLAPVDLMEALQHAVEANGDYALQFGGRLDLLGGPEGLRVRADAGRLQQVLANLISNAVKFSPEGSPVEIWAEAREGGARVFVKNHGPGIRAEFKEHLFHRFAQADRTDARAKGGTGLGLSICKAMVEGMGGAIACETAPEQGATFHFDLPDPESGEAPVEDA